MTRRMSCALTTDQVRCRTKTVTRRRADTWTSLMPGDRLVLVEKAMGLPKGARQIVLADVLVTSVSVERLVDITPAEVAAEGFGPSALWTPGAFVRFWLGSHGYPLALYDAEPSVASGVMCRRIAWSYAR